MDKMDIYEKVSNSDKDLRILSLPIHINVGERLSTVITKRLYDYYELVERELSVEDNYDEEFFLNLRVIIDTLSTVFMLIDDCKFDKAFHALTIGDEIKNLIAMFVHTPSTETFYRGREGKILSKEEMFHVPVNKNFLCRSCRFTEVGYPGLYLSSSKDGCRAEIRKPSTIAKFQLNPSVSIEVLDLTFLNFNKYKLLTLNEQKELHLMWPILASCYCISYWCDYKKKQCESDRQYMEEYTFPQMVARYLRENGIAEGIKYFTVRDENLNPNDEYMTDYVFFTKQYDADGVDRVLRSKFSIEFEHGL